MVFSYQENYLIVILIVPVLFVLYTQLKHKTTFILQSLTAVLNVMFNGSRAEKKDGNLDGDPIMKLTTKMIKQIIREEIEEAKKENLYLRPSYKKLGVPLRRASYQEGFDTLPKSHQGRLC